MRAHRTVLCAVAALVATGVTAAPAKPVVCLQVVDAPNDARAFDAAPSSSLDIVSADLATGKKALVATVRLAALPPDTFQTTGTQYTWTWTVGGMQQSLLYVAYATGGTVGRFDTDSRPNQGNFRDEVTVPVLVDASTKSITWTVPRAQVAALKKPGAKFGGFSLKSWSGLYYRTDSGEGRAGVPGGDVATSGKTYVDGTPTCLKGT
jgi:hypothetical protein